MSEGYEELKHVGIQKIHEDTHISRAHIEIVLNERFEELNKIQFVGFLSILEREYSIDLESLRLKAVEYYQQQGNTLKDNSGVFVVAEKNKKSFLSYIVIIIVIFIIAIVASINYSSEDTTVEIQSIENKIIEDVKKKIKKQDLNIADDNLSVVDLNVSEEKVVKEEIPVEVEKEALKPFTITAKSKVWVGYIDIKTNKKYTKTVKKGSDLSFERNKDWLVILGHSSVKIEANAKNYSFRTKGQLRLLYKDGIVTQISLREFKKLNRGRKW